MWKQDSLFYQPITGLYENSLFSLMHRFPLGLSFLVSLLIIIIFRFITVRENQSGMWHFLGTSMNMLDTAFIKTINLLRLPFGREKELVGATVTCETLPKATNEPTRIEHLTNECNSITWRPMMRCFINSNTENGVESESHSLYGFCDACK